MRYIKIKIPETPGFPAEEYVIKYDAPESDAMTKNLNTIIVINKIKGEYYKLPPDKKSVATAIENAGYEIFEPDDEIEIKLD